MPFNSPIVRKDLKVISRSMKFSWSLFAYEAVLALVFLITLSIASLGSRSYGSVRNNTDIYESYVYFYPVIAVAQICIIALIVPIITASAISGEKERKTMDILLTTSISPTQIILGKIFSAVIRVMIFVVASIPLMAVSFVVGGLSWFTLLEYVVLTFFFALFTGSIGILCSAICKKSITAIILSYVIYGGLYSIPFTGLYLCALFDWQDLALNVSMLPLLFNPVMTFFNHFMGRLSSSDFSELFGQSGHGIWRVLYNKNVWTVVSVLCQLALTVVMVVLATRKIRPGKK
ncbi:MAG: ABC transporter permease [Eubacterium sp.]|nr:ABC transporter permease [Eubacterium sp.]